MMRSTDTAILAEHVTKEYRIGLLNATTLKAALQSRMALRRGLDDPNRRIGDTPADGDIIRAVDDVSFCVRKGERVGIIGRNGAGKSTLLKMISRITAPTEGFIGYNGKVASMLEVGTGFHGELTGRENIYLNGAILGMPRAEVAERFDKIVEFSGVGRFIDTPIKRYSSGMYVRLGFAVAAHLNADIVIMDEVLAVGDLSFQEKCIRKMRSLAEDEERTIIYVSHNMSTVRALCSRCLVMEDGKLVFDGGVDQAESLYRRGCAGTDRIDLSKELRPGFVMEASARFEEASYPDGGKDVRSELTTFLRWSFLRDVGNMDLRIEVRTDKDRPVGAKIFYDVGGGRVGGSGGDSFSIDTSGLRNGSYRTVYVLFRIDENGENENIDVVEGLPFRIDDPGREEKLRWHDDWWGNLHL